MIATHADRGKRPRLSVVPLRSLARDRLHVDCALERMRSKMASIHTLRLSLDSVGLSYDAIASRLRASS